MSRNAERCWLVAVALCVLLAFVSPAQAWDVQEKCTNNTGQLAYDLTKIVIGEGAVTGAIRNQLGTPTITTHSWGSGTVSIIHWGPGGPPVSSTPPNNWVWGCFNSSGRARTIAALWTDCYGRFIGFAAVEVTVYAEWGDDGTLVIIIEHSWYEWTGTQFPPEEGDQIGDPMGPITITDLSYAIAGHMRPLDELNDDLLNDPSIEWFPLATDVTLGSAGEAISYTVDQIGVDDVVLLRYVASGEGISTPTIQQFRPSLVSDVPAPGTTVPN
jgi:hypothetical protein